MTVMVLKVYDESCGEENVYVFSNREQVVQKVTEVVNGKYEGQKGCKKLLKECLTSLKWGQGVVWSLYIDLYTTEFELPKVWLLKASWHNVWDGPDVEFVCSSRESAVKKAVELARKKKCKLNKDEFKDKDIVDCMAARFEIEERGIDE